MADKTLRAPWALLTLALAGCAGADAQDAQNAETVEPAPRLTLETVHAAQYRPVHLAHGVLASADEASVSFLEGGRLAERAVDVGQSVEAGDVLARLDDPGTRNGVRAAQASLTELRERTAQLERDRARSAALRREGVATPEELERATSGLDRTRALVAAATAQLDEARRRHGETTLRAPFDGVVTDVFAEAGELLGPGQPVARLVGAGGLEVVVRVDGTLARELSPDQEVTVRTVGGDGSDPLGSHAMQGRVISVAGAAAALGGAHPVRIGLPDPDPNAAPGHGVVVSFAGRPRSTITVPLGAVMDPSGTHPFVWRVEGGVAMRAPVRVGPFVEGRVVVLDGLASGDTLVAAGHTQLLPGDAIDGADR